MGGLFVKLAFGFFWRQRERGKRDEERGSVNTITFGHNDDRDGIRETHVKAVRAVRERRKRRRRGLGDAVLGYFVEHGAL